MPRKPPPRRCSPRTTNSKSAPLTCTRSLLHRRTPPRSWSDSVPKGSPRKPPPRHRRPQRRQNGSGRGAAPPPPRAAPPGGGAVGGGGGWGSGSGTGSGSGSGSGSRPGPAAADQDPLPSAGAPDQGAVDRAIWFAQQQLGKPYALGGSGPNVWDCSGLTRAAYAYVGIGIGTHSATNQYHTLANRGLAVPVSQAQRGDLLFWGGGSSYYHVAIYLGGGKILEAPDYGKPVRVWYIWGSPSAAARPAG